EYYAARGKCKHEARDPRLDAELGIHLVRDRVRLHHIADAEGCDRGEDGEGNSEPASQRALDTGGEVELRAARLLARSIELPEPNAEERLGVLRRHTDEARDPHPQHGTGAAEKNCRGDACDIAD